MKKIYCTLSVLTLLFASCNDNEVFEKEMYKNVVALISSDYHNTFEEVVPLTGEEVIGYIAASAGGTEAPTKDMVIGLAEDQEPLDSYNWSLFDADENLYARVLPREKYEIADYQIKIAAGERTGRTMVKIRPDGLSPDSTYFIGLKASDMSGVEINPEKNTILYQVLIKNDYASTAEDSYYSMTGLANAMVTAGNKQLYPLTQHSVRVIAGTESFQGRVDHIANTSITLDVAADGKVTIKPYENIQVTQVDGDERYPNVFRVEESFGRRFNVFLLSYDYVIGNTTRRMQEELRQEIKR